MTQANCGEGHDPEQICCAHAAEVERLHTWAGLMSLLDEHYPADVPLGPDSDPGPRILRLTRELDRLRDLRDLRRQLWRELGRPDGFGLDIELLDAVHDAVRSGRDARAELARLRARDETADSGRRYDLDDVLAEAGIDPSSLDDALARAHEGGAGDE